MRFRTYKATPQAVSQARWYGVYGDTAKRIARMARRAAPFTHDLGNRRFDQFVLEVEQDEVRSIHRLASC